MYCSYLLDCDLGFNNSVASVTGVDLQAMTVLQANTQWFFPSNREDDSDRFNVYSVISELHIIMDDHYINENDDLFVETQLLHCPQFDLGNWYNIWQNGLRQNTDKIPKPEDFCEPEMFELPQDWQNIPLELPDAENNPTEPYMPELMPSKMEWPSGKRRTAWDYQPGTCE